MHYYLAKPFPTYKYPLTLTTGSFSMTFSLAKVWVHTSLSMQKEQKREKLSKFVRQIKDRILEFGCSLIYLSTDIRPPPVHSTLFLARKILCDTRRAILASEDFSFWCAFMLNKLQQVSSRTFFLRQGIFSNFGGTGNCISGARIKILRPFFNTN